MITASVHRQAVQQPGSRFDFGSIAETYDRWYETRKGRVYDALEKRAIARTFPRPAPGLRLLDVGCGTGHWSAFFSARGFEVTGVDIAPEMVAVARKKRIAHAAFQVADAHALPFDDEAFDVTAAITTLEFVRDAETIMQEMIRCTRRHGGVVLVGVLNSLAAVNAERKSRGAPLYADARFFSPIEVETMLARYVEPGVSVAAFVPRIAAALPLAPAASSIGE